MIRQHSFQGDTPTLYVVATPIGNLQELTPRAIEILSSVAIIAAEDTRHTMKLLQYFQIKTKCIAHHLHNEKESSKGIIKLLQEHNSVALVSDAGYPLLSDPGQLLVQSVIEQGYHVVPISGSSALLNALVASGLCVQPFLFYGFLEATESKRVKSLQTLDKIPYTIVFYEAPHRIEKMLHSLYSVFGNRRICIARELTKQYEEFIRGDLVDIMDALENIKGEIVVIVEGNMKQEEISMDVLVEEIDNLVQSGIRSKDAIKEIASTYSVSKNELYAYYLENGNK